MNIFNLSIILILSLIVLFQLKRDFTRGISLAIFLLILMPAELSVEISRNIPILSGYRAILIVLFFYSLLSQGTLSKNKVPLIKLLILLLILKGISLPLSVNFSQSLKDYVSFILEFFMFYIIMSKAVNDDRTIKSLLFSISSAIIIIAVIGVIERYTNFNPVDYIPVAERLTSNRHDVLGMNIVYSTFSHPILLGTALAMGLPIYFTMVDMQNKSLKKYLMEFGIIIIYICIYFTFSRGPWLSLLLVLGLLVLLKYPKIQYRVISIMILTLFLITVKSGVYTTIYRYVNTTFDESTLEGGSFYYRFELWKKAYSEVSRSIERTLVGYGLGSHHTMNMEGIGSYTGKVRKFWSWDNQFAVILLEEGFIGLIIYLLLYFSIIKFMLKTLRVANDKDRVYVIALLTSIFVLIFMMTNVRIFAPQLFFLMWTNVSIGVAIYNKYMPLGNKTSSRLVTISA